VVIWYIFSHFGILYQEKYGNPAPDFDPTAPDYLISSLIA
jgi:hypothetical protein